MKRFGKIVYGALAAVMGVLMVLGLWQAGARLFCRQELPKIFGWSQVVVLSGSMEPSFSPGDLLLVQEQDAYAVGEWVTFQQKGSYITHRITGERDGCFVTKGDANNTEDKELLAKEQIHGAVKLVVPKVGNVFLFLKTPAGILCILLLALLFAGGPGFIRHLRERRQRA